MVQALPGLSISPPRGRPPGRFDHTLKRNKYPDSVFNHDLSYALEAGLHLKRVACFLCDPEGATCITLHSFTIFSAMFTSDTGTGRRRISLPVHTSRMTQVPALKRALANILSIAPAKMRQVTCQEVARRSIRTPVTGVYLSPKKV
jgi:hypothetical protein